jgi:hypothetical protein
MSLAESQYAYAEHADTITTIDENGYFMINSLYVENFRCFKSLELQSLKRINVIVGKNASGKTALLEVLRAGLSGIPAILPWLNATRSIPFALPQNPVNEQFQALFVDFFHNFDIKNPITIRVEDSNGHNASVRIFFDSSRAVTVQPTLGFRPQGGPASPPPNTLIPLVFERSNFQAEKNTLVATINPAGQLFLEPGKEMGVVAGFFGSTYMGVSPENAFWLSNLSVEKRSNEVIDALHRHFPFIRAVTSEITAGGMGAVYAELDGLPRKIPLALVSGGISRMFTLILSMLTFRGGAVFVDEVENGIYYDQYPLMWRTLTDLAEQHKTQLFVTTHSNECLHAIIDSMKGHEENFTLLHVERNDKGPHINLVEGQFMEAAIEQDFELR